MRTTKTKPRDAKPCIVELEDGTIEIYAMVPVYLGKADSKRGFVDLFYRLLLKEKERRGRKW